MSAYDRLAKEAATARSNIDHRVKVETIALCRLLSFAEQAGYYLQHERETANLPSMRLWLAEEWERLSGRTPEDAPGDTP